MFFFSLEVLSYWHWCFFSMNCLNGLFVTVLHFVWISLCCCCLVFVMICCFVVFFLVRDVLFVLSFISEWGLLLLWLLGKISSLLVWLFCFCWMSTLLLLFCLLNLGSFLVDVADSFLSEYGSLLLLFCLISSESFLLLLMTHFCLNRALWYVC